ncbi:Beta-ketoadipate enol-lactone hydrolase [Rhodovulum sp. PH10]|uniref:alpha/beta fold hydrolase n=1 Tax=Rhodovulum sp. PH10 TaxID=1187851 RepID=UPI00027C2866|nr:alpha/beta fold hydrolase [Rhodovulum sp. PH10]EJW13463.1 Beta-ketoadipate enol-lactone hydrolase [Rhodovulum sp. PH10]
MPDIGANGIRIAYDTFGDRRLSALLLVAGSGAQLTFWDAEFCEMLARAGHFVIRFDNRDAGLSTKFDAAGTPDISAVVTAVREGRRVEPPYSLDDMADDAAGLLDSLGIGAAHVCGASMGGMIAQIVACRHPHRVSSLTSIMSSTGNPGLPHGRPEAIAAVLAPAPSEREAYVEHNLAVWRAIWSPGFPFEEARARTFLATGYDRSFCPQGMVRQNVAVIASGDRRPALSSIAAPTLVIHGSADPLIPVEAGEDTARTIPGAELLIVEGMGHDMPTPVWERMAAAIARNAKRSSSGH